MNYEFALNNKTDEEIIRIIRNGNKNAINTLIERYKDIVKYKAHRYFILGADENDVFQEGMIGLYLAIKNFDDTKVANFNTFANMCIDRQLITALKTANRQKHYVLNNAVSLNASYDENENVNEKSEIINIVKNEEAEDPLNILVDTEYKKSITNEVYKQLSVKEKSVLNEYIKGKSYLEIAKELNCKTKSVDTALTRVRRKASKILKEINSKFDL